MPDPAPHEDDLPRLRADRDALRAERDIYQEELGRLRSSFAVELQSRLEASGRDVRTEVETQVNALANRWKWLLALVTAAAGLGGFASIPGWIDGKVTKAVDNKVSTEVAEELNERQRQVDDAMERAKTKLEVTLSTTQEGVASLRKEVENAASAFREESADAVGDFREKAAMALKDVDAHASKTKEEITERGRLAIVEDDAGGTKVVLATKEKVTWFGDVPANVVAIGGSEFKQFASESEDKGVRMGRFSVQFQRALRSSQSDTTADSSISWREAFEWTARQMAKTDFKQSPVLEGARANETAFFLKAKRTGKTGVLRAVLVGCSNFTNSNMPELPGPANDALGLKKLLEEGEKAHLLAKASLIPPKVLVNENATSAQMLAAITTVIADAKAEDLVLFFFSGHIAQVPTEQTKQLIAYDTKDTSGDKSMRADEIVKGFGKCAATVVVIIDG